MNEIDYDHYIRHHSSNEWKIKRFSDNNAEYKSKLYDISGDLIQFEQGIILGRGHINLKNYQNYSHSYNNFNPKLRFHFFPQGGVKHNLFGDPTYINKDCLLIYGGFLDNYSIQLINKKASRLSIDIPQELINKWMNDKSISNFINSYLHLNNFVDINYLNNNTISKLGKYILKIKNLNTFSSYLELQTLILNFINMVISYKNKEIEQESFSNFRKKNLDYKINQAVRIIHSSYDRNISIYSLSQNINLNESYLKKEFKLKTGKTIGNYINEIRMKKAMELITQTKLTLQEISYFVGYKDYSHFLKFFKNTFCYLPNELRHIKIKKT